MSLAAELRAATGPLVNELIPDLGSRVTVRRASVTRATDNSPIKGWVTPAGGTNVPVKLTIVTDEKRQRAWGLTSNVSVEGMMPIGIVDIAAEDGIQVTSGFLAGREFRVEQVIPSDLGQYVLLGMAEGRGDIG